jgi:hypothetical protein
LYILSTWWIKLSFCLTLRPLLRDAWPIRILWATALLVSAYSIAYLLACGTLCGISGTDEACLAKQAPGAYGHAAILITTDLCLAALSLQIATVLQMKRSMKISVLLLLLFGSR